YVGEVIDRAEAERRFEAEINEAQSAVSRFMPGLDEGTNAALVSLTFNAGTSWMKSGLGSAIKAGDLETAKTIFKQYTCAGGTRLPGLVARRDSEAEWIGSGSPDQKESWATTPVLNGVGEDAIKCASSSDIPSIGDATRATNAIDAAHLSAVPALSSSAAVGFGTPIFAELGRILFEMLHAQHDSDRVDAANDRV
ncbi:MAG: glycoside hydrolase family protein, partial [Proteobacteria bacterium]|nr:glycoside hydrolase family protein [Pseudomonadota bacterium]